MTLCLDCPRADGMCLWCIQEAEHYDQQYLDKIGLWREPERLRESLVGVRGRNFGDRRVA